MFCFSFKCVIITLNVFVCLHIKQTKLNLGGDWASWGAFTPCDATCGPGLKQRRRKCIGRNCVGSGLQFRRCLLLKACASM